MKTRVNKKGNGKKTIKFYRQQNLYKKPDEHICPVEGQKECED